MKIIVGHEGYGCDTGCCGHVVEIVDAPEDWTRDTRKFNFDHPYGETHREFAENLVRQEFGEQHVADLDWDNCLIVED